MHTIKEKGQIMKLNIKHNNTNNEKLKDNIKELEEQKENNDTVDSKLELLKYTSQVQSRIRNDITSDYTLAKLEAKDKEFVIEHAVTAFYAKKVILQQLNKKKYDWKQNPDSKKTEIMWIERKLNEYEKKIIRETANAIFDSFMNRLHMLVITNRNVDSNHLLRYLSGLNDEGQPVEDPEEKKLSTKLKKIVEPQQQGDEK